MALVTYLSASGVQRIGWLAPGTAHAGVTRTALARLADATRLQIVGDEVYPIGDGELAERYRRLQTMGAQVVLAWPHDVRGAAALMSQLGVLRNWVPLFLGPVAVDPTTLGVVGDAADGVHSVTSRLRVADDLWDHDTLTPAVRDFGREFRLRYGSPPDDESAAAWDAPEPRGQSGPTGADSAGGPRCAGTHDRPAGRQRPDHVHPRPPHGLDDRAFVVARASAGRWRLPP